jgi:peptide/nickel transport system permease protein
MNLRRFLIFRSIQIVITFFIILTLLFLLFRAAPGDPVDMMTDPTMNPIPIRWRCPPENSCG